MNEMYYPYYLFQGGGQRVPNRLGRSEQNILLNLNKNGNAVISGGFNVERGPLGIRRKISHGPIYVIPTQLAQSIVNANGNQSGNTTDSNVDAMVRSAESFPVQNSLQEEQQTIPMPQTIHLNSKQNKEVKNFADLWNTGYQPAYSFVRKNLRPTTGYSQNASSSENSTSQSAPSNESASNSNDYFSNLNEGQRQAAYAGLSNEYNRRNAGQEKYEWASDVTVTPKSNKKGNRVNYSEFSQYRVPYIGSQYIPPSNDFTPIQYTIPTFEGNPAVYQYGSQVDPERINKIRSKEPIYYDNRGEVWPIDNFLPRNEIGYHISNGLQNQSPYYQIGGIVEMAPGYYREYELADKMYNDHIKKHRDEIRRQYIPHYVPNYNASDYDWLINQANKLLEAEKEKNFFNQLRYDPNIQLKKMDRLSIVPPLDFIPPYTYMCGGSKRR